MTGVLLVLLVALSGDLACAPCAWPCGGARDGSPQTWAQRDASNCTSLDLAAGAASASAAMVLLVWQAAPAITPSQTVAYHP